MNIQIHRQTIGPMAAWLQAAKQGNRDEAKLREILNHPDYGVEFARYGEEGLPVCGINFEEAVDFFLHFDEKDFENPRLAYKRESFLKFYENLESRLEAVSMLDTITPEDMALVQKLLEGGLPKSVLDSLDHITILLTISIGNSMGWPYGEYIHFDVANLEMLGDKETFLHVLAHEIHHVLFSALLPEDMTPQQYFFVNFAFEGLAVHFCNNAATVGKPAKYAGPALGMDGDGWAFYEAQHDALIAKALEDGEKARNMTMEQVAELVSTYEQFTFTSLATGENRTVLQYPTYYIGCYLWGRIDLELGKDRLFEILASRDGFAEIAAMFTTSSTEE